MIRRPCAGRGLLDALAPDSRSGPCLRRGDEQENHSGYKVLDMFLFLR
jgi:hypothetical protein